MTRKSGMKGSILVSSAVILGFLHLSCGADRFVTLDNFPLGECDNPVVLRTYFPDPGLERVVLSNYAMGERARKYSPGKGDVEGFVEPLPGIPAAIGVSFGPDLSLCWDTTECRLLYAWSGGFLDMTNYWGKPESGRRKGFGYLPSLVGDLIYLTRGSHPLAIFDHFTESLKPQYLGYTLVERVPEFRYEVGDAIVRVTIFPGESPMSIVKRYTIEGVNDWDYVETGYVFEKKEIDDATFEVTIQGRQLDAANSVPEEPAYTTDKPNVPWGEALYTDLGCFACHSKDGTRGHGPSFAGLYGAARSITGAGSIVADEAYIAESITDPMAKVVETYPAGYMPPYPLDKKQVKALTMFIKTLANE
ncbi:MAG: cytochrome c [Verrucomicrobiota bacterium]